MKQRDILALMDGIAPGIAASFAKAIAPVLARLEAAEKRVAEFEKAPADIDLDAMIAAVVEKALATRVPKEVAALELKIDGEELKKAIGDAVTPVAASIEKLALDLGEVQDMVTGLPKVPTAEEVRALIPTPENGKSVTLDEVRPLVDEAVAAIPRIVQDGKDATPEQIAAAVETVLATWPKPKDGDSVTLEQLRPLVDETVAKRVAEIPAPKDGVGLAGGMINRAGELSLTLTDGKVVELGLVVGDAGNDGLGFDDIEMTDNGLTCTIAFKRGDQVKAFEFAKPTLADAWQGVWKAGPYRKGQAVTWGGSLWIAMADTEARPETDDSWKLAVKRGRDGKDLTPSEPKPPKTVKL